MVLYQPFPRQKRQQTMKKTMLALRKTPAGEEYYEVSNKRGAVLATKNHQGGLDDQDDESNGKKDLAPSAVQ